MDRQLRDIEEGGQTIRRFGLKLVLLVALFAGAVSPVVRNAWYADYLGVGCTVVLTIIAGFAVFAPRKV